MDRLVQSAVATEHKLDVSPDSSPQHWASVLVNRVFDTIVGGNWPQYFKLLGILVVAIVLASLVVFAVYLAKA